MIRLRNLNKILSEEKLGLYFIGKILSSAVRLALPAFFIKNHSATDAILLCHYRLEMRGTSGIINLTSALNKN